MTIHPGYDNPQLTLTDNHSGADVACDVCRQPIGGGDERWTLTTGRTPRLDLRAVAHAATGLDIDGDGPCFERLCIAWLELVALVGAGTLQRDRSDQHWTLDNSSLHCGTPLQILTGDGIWLDGSFEIADQQHGPTPCIVLTLGGLNQPNALLTIPPGALLRRRPRPRR